MVRSEMIARRMDCLDRYPNVEHLGDDRWRGTDSDLRGLAVDLDRVDRANLDLLRGRKWREIPGQVLRAILRELSHPPPDNVTR